MTPHLLQVFLGKHGVHEVSVTPVEHSLTCTCPGFAARKKCRHVQYIREHLDDNGGYVVSIPDHATSDLNRSSMTPESWREFVLRYAPVVVL